MKYIFLCILLSSCGYNMTKEAFMEIKIEAKLEEYRLKEKNKCEIAYWKEVNEVADSLLAKAAIENTDSLVVKITSKRPNLNYTPRFQDTVKLEPLFDNESK